MVYARRCEGGKENSVVGNRVGMFGVKRGSLDEEEKERKKKGRWGKLNC